MKLIDIKKLTFEYFRRDADGNVTEAIDALKDITLEVEQGDFIAILGRNGSGKSTLAKHINALLFPKKGEVIVDGMDTTKEELLLEIRQTAGMVFQNPDNQIVGNLVEEDTAFGPENLGVPTTEIRDRVKDALTITGMESFRNQSPNHLSGGQKQRVAIAGVLAMNPKCIIFDEATAMLDPQGRRQMIEVAKKLQREQGITIILITHHMDEVLAADKVFVMKDGTLMADGSPEEIFLKKQVLAECGLSLPELYEYLDYLMDQNIITHEERIHIKDGKQLSDLLCVKYAGRMADRGKPGIETEKNSALKNKGKEQENITENHVSVSDLEEDTEEKEQLCEREQSYKGERPEKKEQPCKTEQSYKGERPEKKEQPCETEQSYKGKRPEKKEQPCKAEQLYQDEKTDQRIEEEGIRLCHVSYQYNKSLADERLALKDVSLQLTKGEFVAVIGHTGSGKSTLMQHLDGLYLPTEGTVYFNGKDISAPKFPIKELRQKVGLVFQYPEYQLFAETVEEDVLFGPENLGISKDEAKKRAHAALEAVGLPETIYKNSPLQLSGGQKRRVAIAGVLAMQPEYLVLDEPTAGLDPLTARSLLNMLKELQRSRDIAIVIVSHSMEEVAEYADRIIVMEQGEKIMDGAVWEVFEQDERLQKIGLAVPTGITLLHDLKKEGFDVDTTKYRKKDIYKELTKLNR